MKKLFSVIALLTCMLGFKKDVKAQIVSGPSISVTRTAGGESGSASTPLQLTFRKPSGLFTLTETKTFSSVGSVQTYTATAPATGSITFIASIDGLTSKGTYNLPTAINDYVTIPSDDCGMTNYAGQYGYSVTVKCVGTNQYTVAVTKLLCSPSHPCVPCTGL